MRVHSQKVRKSIGTRLSGFAVFIAFLALVSLTALALPALEGHSVDQDLRRTEERITEIANAIRQYEIDTGSAPTGLEGRSAYNWLRGPGAEPRFQKRPIGEPGRLAWFFHKPHMAKATTWMGPYLEDIAPDPWGRPFLVIFAPKSESVGPAQGRTRMILSAGPDGIVQSDLTALVPKGDDLVRLDG